MRGIKNTSLFLSALKEPQQTYGGKDLYPDILSKAAAYLRSFALNHAFHDGNKRTALMSMIIFLEQNGYEVVADSNKLLHLAKTIVIEKPEIKQIVRRYLKKYCRFIGQRKYRLRRAFEKILRYKH